MKRRTSDMLAPRIEYDGKTGEYIIWGRQPMFGCNGKAKEVARAKTKPDARLKLKQALAEDAKRTDKELLR